MIRAKTKTAVSDPIFFDWDGVCAFQVREIPKEETKELLHRCEKTVFRQHRKETETDFEKFGAEYIRLAVIGWRGLTYRGLLQICEPLELDEGVTLDDEIEFSKEHLDYLAEHAAGSLVTFLNYAASQYGVLRIEAEEAKRKAEAENLPRTSVGS